jgi:hypothetical protein
VSAYGSAYSKAIWATDDLANGATDDAAHDAALWAHGAAFKSAFVKAIVAAFW